MAETVQLAEIPEEMLTPRELRLERAGAILRWGAVANVVISFGLLALVLLGALGLTSGVFPTLHNLLLMRVTAPDDAAAAGVILFMQINTSVLLVLMVGILARELWALIGVWLLVIANLVAAALFGFSPALITV